MFRLYNRTTAYARAILRQPFCVAVRQRVILATADVDVVTSRYKVFGSKSPFSILRQGSVGLA